jgi:hypothetical protein
MPLQVTWPNGHVDKVTPPEINRTIVIQEGQGIVPPHTSAAPAGNTRVASGAR